MISVPLSTQHGEQFVFSYRVESESSPARLMSDFFFNTWLMTSLRRRICNCNVWTNEAAVCPLLAADQYSFLHVYLRVYVQVVPCPCREFLAIHMLSTISIEFETSQGPNQHNGSYKAARRVVALASHT